MENWKQKVKEKLLDYGLQKVAIDNIPHEIKRLEIENVSIRSATADGSPVKGGGNGREARILWNIMQREDLKRNMQMAIEYVTFVDTGLSVLTAEEKRVVEMMYIYPQRNAVEQLRNELGLEDKRSVYKRMDKILYKITLAMYGVESS